jgi:DedD protein
MEKKKLLLISASTGVFLMLVIGASILIFTPPSFSPPPATEVAVIQPGKPADVPGLTKPVEEPVEVVPQDIVPQVSIIAEPVKPPVVNIEVSAVEKAVTPPVVEAPKPAPAPAPKPVAAPKPKSEAAYWVQIGSYTQKSGADKAKMSLSERGLGSVIFDGDIQGKTFYRVRVGPYVSRAEADYWLRFVKEIDGFENSQVWKSGI